MEQLPERIDAESSRRWAGHSFDQSKFDALKGEDGCISREQHLVEMVGESQATTGKAPRIAHTDRQNIALRFQDISFTVQDKKTKTSFWAPPAEASFYLWFVSHGVGFSLGDFRYPSTMGTEVVPERVDAGTSRRLVGHTFSQGKFDKLKGEDGCISREQHLNEMAGASALEMGDLGKSKSTTGSEIAFSFQDISFTVQDKKTKTEKVIIQNVSATVTPGHVLAIMGPSGAGKTTLINSLTLSAFGGVTTGSVKLGSDHMTPSLFEQHCYVVTQQDFHWPFLAHTDRQNIALRFQDISFTVQDKKTKTEKVIIQDISATVRPGHVLAIMGPSGAGKTTLINVLTLSAFGGVSRGSVTLGSDRLTPALFQQHCYVVTQQDFHWPFLTCRETLQYAAELYLQDDATAREERVNTVIKKMGLESCADTICGNEFVQGLSGGQKRRLSIGLALIKEPILIFLDEPTSGLDAAAAANIMRFITELAAEDQLIVVATIHQPSTKVYEGFDQVMILSEGKEAFMGPALNAVDYFASIGHPMPDQTNPAEFFLDLVNSDFTSSEDVDTVLQAWESHRAKNKKGEEDEAAAMVSVHTEDESGVAFLDQCGIMIRRHAYLAVRDPVPYIGRACIYLISNTYFALVYVQARKRQQDQVLNRFWVIVWFIGVAANLGVVAVFASNAEFNSVKKEIKNGMISPVSYLLAKSLLEIPIMLIFSVFALGIPAYGIVRFDSSQFGLYMVVWALCLYVWENIALMFSVQFQNPLIGMMQYTSMWFSGFLFAGFLIPVEDMVWPLKIFFYIMPFRYALHSMNFLEFHDSFFHGFAECLSEGKEDEICFGKNGRDVLRGVHDVFGVVNAKNTLGQDLGILLAIAAVWRVGYCFLVLTKSRAATTVVSN
eukprot:CAMPEP_0118998186 /NCGR_PEP_ID=MMETSP1173-20130426/62939_1 /TAXON_ID=1034831 /ORGANISM="Rhizochromulina marina cf, Strain CCMP1243" /LENGTH=888 /DNA_ID=CAMNT_0006949667 /DNA_START=69 /DNA_END=2736 /DNA_ORIENTATION=-